MQQAVLEAGLHVALRFCWAAGTSWAAHICELRLPVRRWPVPEHLTALQQICPAYQGV